FSRSWLDHLHSDVHTAENGYAASGGMSKSAKVVLEHDPEKWIPVFGQACPRARPEGSCSNNKLERAGDSKKSHLALARISHTRCACAGSRSRQGRSRAQFDVVHQTSAATHPVGFFNRPSGLLFGGHLRRRVAQPYGPIRFRHPPPYLPRRKSNAGRMECEKCGLGLRQVEPDVQLAQLLG